MTNTRRDQNPIRRGHSLFSLERTASTSRVTWVTLVGLILVPLVIGGLLVWALWNPAERLGKVQAAVVNLDQPVTVDGHLVPLGRELAAGLLTTTSNNYQWVLTNESDARSGINDGAYVAVVTIPKNFSAAATSLSGNPSDAHHATISVRSSTKSKLIDPTISQALTTVATGVFNNQVTATYLNNIYVGFNTIHSQIGEAASGAQSLSAGLTQLASGSQQLSAAAGEVASGSSQLADGLSTASTGASKLSSGSQSVSSGVSALSSGLNTLSQSSEPLITLSQGVSTGITNVGSALQAMSAQCNGNTSELCLKITALSASVNQAQAPDQLSLVDAASTLYSATQGVNSGISESASAAQRLAQGSMSVANGTASLASGIADSATGAGKLAGGTQQLAAGVNSLSQGASESAAGSQTLASGLATAAERLPHYTESERKTLSSVAAQPVTTSNSATAGFGASSVPLFASLALWLGALATFIVLQAYSRRALLTSRASLPIALHGFVPGGVVGVIQGIVFAAIMQPALHLDAGHWFALAGVAALTGVAFAAVNHGLVALIGGSGRFVSMTVIVIALASGIVSTTPGFFSSAMTWLPIRPAMTALQGVITSTGNIPTGIAGLVLWLFIGLALGWVGVARRRMVSTRSLLPSE